LRGRQKGPCAAGARPAQAAKVEVRLAKRVDVVVFGALALDGACAVLCVATGGLPLQRLRRRRRRRLPSCTAGRGTVPSKVGQKYFDLVLVLHTYA